MLIFPVKMTVTMIQNFIIYGVKSANTKWSWKTHRTSRVSRKRCSGATRR